MIGSSGTSTEPYHRPLSPNRTAPESNNTATLLHLPTEIWIKIARFASEPVWSETQFYPPRKDIRAVLGFKAACKQFEDIVEIVESETVHLDKDISRANFARAARLHPTRVRCVSVNITFYTLIDIMTITFQTGTST
jgi:hypothetical protein